MRSLYAIIITVSIFLSGCATLDLGGKEWDTYLNYKIRVTSQPSDAQIYVNNVLAGKTPIDSLPITVPFQCQTDSFGTMIMHAKEQLYLRVSKEGYKDAAEPIEFIVNVGYKYTKMKKTDYHFVLEKK